VTFLNTKHVFKSCNTLFDHPLLLLASTGLDLLFFFISGFVFQAYFYKILEYISAFSFQESSLTKVGVVVAVMTFMLYLVYCVLQGVSWWIAGKASGRKQGLQEYLKPFFKINILWTVLFLGINLALYGITLMHRTKQLEVPTPFTLLFTVAFALLFALAFASYTSKETTIKKQVKQAWKTTWTRKVFLVMGEILLVFIIINLLLKVLTGPALILLGLLLVFPALFWAKVFLFQTHNNNNNNNNR
jgi:hypothetical protein